MNKVVTAQASTKSLSNGSTSCGNINKNRKRGKRISPARQLSKLSLGESTKKNGKYRTTPHPTIGPNSDLPPDHLLNDPEILEKIGNRAVKTVTNNKPTSTYDKCRKHLIDDGCTEFGKDTQETCCVCQHKITGDCVVSGTKLYHPGCIKCDVCGEALKGSYITYMNKPICSKDYENVQKKCTKCEEIIKGTYYTLNEKIFCEKDYMAQIDSCHKCEKEVMDKHVHIINGITFHPECFNCQKCGKNMEGASFTTDDQTNVYCPEDYAKKFGAVCSACKKTIVPKEGQTKASRLWVMGRDFHIKCFKCEDCGMIQDSHLKGKDCYPIKDHILCIKCNVIRQNKIEEE